MQKKNEQIRAEISAISDLLKAGRADKAFKRATKTAKKWSDVSAFPRLAALSAVQQQKHKLAQTYFERAWRLDPLNKELIQNYALNLVQCGSSAEALVFLEKIASRAPLDPEQMIIQARALLHERRENEALVVIDMVLKDVPENLQALGLKADILDELRQWSQALETLRTMVAINPKFHFSQLRFSKACASLGHVDDSLAAARVALQLSPLDGETLRFMAKLPNLTDSDKSTLRVQVAKALQGAGNTNHENLGALHFAAARLARTDKDLDAEFQHLEQAHYALKGDGQAMDKKVQQVFRKRLSAALPAVVSQPRQDVPRPIFVVGLPRSGTTMVERMLSAHSAVQGLGEMITVQLWARQTETDPSRSATAGELADFYVQKMPALAAGTLAFVDKMPGNYAHLGVIAQAFPNAVILNMQRDPRDIALSMWREYFNARGLFYTHDFRWMSAEANRYQSYIYHWRNLLPGRIQDLRYEDIVTNPEKAARQLATLCDLTFEDSMLSPQNSSDGVLTASVLQVRRPVSASSVGGWQQAAEVLQPFIAGLDPALWPDVSSATG